MAESGKSIERRSLGKTGERVSILGFGGFTLSGLTQEDANHLVDKVIARGVNYFDVAPSYGNAEQRLGPALKGKREGVFLACKTLQRTAEGAKKEFQASLDRLYTDHFDLYQLHSVNTDEDIAKLTAPGGALEYIRRAKEKGMCRFIGFSSHSEEAALKLLDLYPFDTVLFPVNWVALLNGGFGKALLKKAEEKGAARLAIKAMAQAAWAAGEEKKFPNCWYHPVEDPALARLALRFTLSQPVTAAIPPADHRFYDLALDVASDFSPVTAEEVDMLAGKAASIAPLFPRP